MHHFNSSSTRSKVKQIEGKQSKNQMVFYHFPRVSSNTFKVKSFPKNMCVWCLRDYYNSENLLTHLEHHHFRFSFELSLFKLVDNSESVQIIIGINLRHLVSMISVK
jgi:hypothetical protein